VSSAQANLDQLFSDPTESQEMRAQANIERAQANLEQARLNREYAELRAPFAGEVAVINIDPGDPAPTGGSPAMRIVDMSDLRVEVDVTDADIDKVHIGQDAQVIADALPEQVFEGEVSFISPTADTNPQGVTTYRVRIDLVEENLPLRVGMSVSVNIDTDD
jgi:HlyD family secretion protein